MSPVIAIATVAITAALLFYTFGVFGERRRHYLEKRHVVLFWLGLTCDTTGTLLMSYFANTGGSGTLGLHALTGILAIALMIVHAIWATAVFTRGTENARRLFSRFSIVVWLVWLVPYVCGILIGMPMTGMDGAPAVGIATVLVACIALLIRCCDGRRTATKIR